MTKDLDALAAELEFAVAEADCKPGEFAGCFISISQLRALLAERKQMKAALASLVDAVSNMRAPQTLEDAGMQIHLTLGPALTTAKAALTQEGVG